MLNTNKLRASYNSLLKKRDSYKNISWKSSDKYSNTKYTKLWEMEDDYILNIMRKLGPSLYTAQTFNQVEELQSYEGVTYEEWISYFTNEYLYRKAYAEVVYDDYLDQEIYQQSVRDKDYYDDKYHYPSYGDCF